MTVENRIYNAILTTIDKLENPELDMAVRSITGLLRLGPISVLQNSDQSDFRGITENNLPMSASSRLELNIGQDKIGETRDIVFEEGDFPALGPSYDRRAQTHHVVTGHSAPRNSIPDFLTGRSTQNSQEPEQFPQPQNMATHISHDNALPMVDKTPQGQNSDSSKLVNRLAKAIVGFASQQRPPMCTALFKPTTLNTLIFNGKNGRFEVFHDFFQTMPEKQPEMSKAMKKKNLLSHLR